MKDFLQKKIRNNKIKNELDGIEKWEVKIKQKDLRYKADKYKHDFQQYETKRSFGESIYASKITTDAAEEDQSNLLKNIVEFNEEKKRYLREYICSL